MSLSETVERMRYFAQFPSFNDWTRETVASKPDSQRLGQWVYNCAPPHIANAVNGHVHLDPFYVDSNDRFYVVNNFLALAELIWATLDVDEIELARQMVLSEPNAIR